MISESSRRRDVDSRVWMGFSTKFLALLSNGPVGVKSSANLALVGIEARWFVRHFCIVSVLLPAWWQGYGGRLTFSGDR